jgi:transposase
VEWLPENHLVFFLLDLASELDLGVIYDAYFQKDPRGVKAYDPRMMVVLLLYAYCVGLPSSRRIEKTCWEDAAFRVLTGNQQPDHSRISDFRRRHLDALAGLFVQVLRLCQKAGLVSLGHVALLNEVLGLEIGKPPSDSTFRYLFLQLDVAFEALLLQWMSQQPALVDGVDTLVCDGKTLRGSIDQKPGRAATFIAQVSLYSQQLGVAIAQTTYATDESSETAALQRLLSGIELTDVLVQADALHGNRPFFSRGAAAEASGQ